MKIYPTFSEKSFKMGTLKLKIEKWLCCPFLSLRYLQEKKSQISVQVASDDVIVLISQTNKICFRLNLRFFPCKYLNKDSKKGVAEPFFNFQF